MPTTPDHNRSGVEAAMRGDLSTAEQHFLKAYAASPDNAGIALNIGRLMQMQNRHQDLISFFEKNYTSTQQQETIPIQLRYMIAKSATITQNDKLTIKLLNGINNIASQPVDLAINLSEAFIRQGQLAQAKNILQHGLERYSRDPSLLTNLAIVESEFGHYKKAELLYQKVVEYYPNQFLGHFNFGKFLALLGRNREAKQCFNKCLALVPNAPEAQQALQSLDAGEENNNGLKPYTGIEACYRAIESKNWSQAIETLKKDRNLIDPIRLQAIVTELPSEFQSEFGTASSYTPSEVVYTEQLIPADSKIIFDLIKEVHSEASLVWNRAGKPTRQGFQTHELFSQEAGQNIRCLESNLRESLKTYLSEQSSLPIELDPDETSISGWGVILKQGGYQKRHIHPEAKISGVIYLSTPDETSSKETDEGNLIFSTQSPLSISPNAGLVVLFPSYMPHETVPQESKENERVCIAFNFN